MIIAGFFAVLGMFMPAASAPVLQAELRNVHAKSTDVIIASSAPAEKKPKEAPQFAVVLENITITAYTSSPEETDDTPFIMASGRHVYDGAVASNFLAFGTKVRFPELYGDKVFTVEDRMHRRFSDRMDIWMETKHEARTFGKQQARVEVLAAAN